MNRPARSDEPEVYPPQLDGTTTMPQSALHPARPSARPRVVILGASLAGLLTAAALSRHTDVVLVDRDPLDEELTSPRRGVPQSRHTHGLLVSGSRAMEALLPGLLDEVVARGAILGDVIGGSRWVMRGAPMLSFPSTLIGVLCTRTLLESQVRRRVRSLPGVELLGEHDIVALVTDDASRRVIGARLVPRTGPDAGIETVLAADLVVDATGRGSRLSRWFAELGYDLPEVTEVAASVGYATRVFHDERGVLDGTDVIVVSTDPQTGRSGAAARIEGGRWTVTVAQANGAAPPIDLPEFTAFADSLPAPELGRLVRACQPDGTGVVYRFPSSRWVRYERLRRRPLGVLAVGDAVCSFNPVYGQGMSSASLQAAAVRDLVEECVAARGGDVRAALDDLASRAPAVQARVVSAPWALATGPDRRLPGMPRKPLPERLLDRYVDRVIEVARHDAPVTVAFMEVLNLLRPPQSLLAPGIARRVLGARAHRAPVQQCVAPELVRTTTPR